MPVYGQLKNFDDPPANCKAVLQNTPINRMHLIIKNMVCPRCIASVAQLLQAHNLSAAYIRLGEVELKKPPMDGKLKKFAEALQQNGFELLDDQKTQQIEQIKNLLIKQVQSGRVAEHFSISKYLSAAVFKDYSAISKLFSAVEGITMEQFFIRQKIEKAKEWLMYNEKSLSQMAFDLGYSSTQHLSGQFKKLTGMTPSEFKKLGALNRKSIDNVTGG